MIVSPYSCTSKLFQYYPKMSSVYLEIKQSIEILESASTGMRSSSNGICNHSKKQYYVRLKRLVEMGLVEKRKAIYNLTAFGLLVYENHFKTMIRSFRITGKSRVSTF
jgi:hypothetical protein